MILPWVVTNGSFLLGGGMAYKIEAWATKTYAVLSPMTMNSQSFIPPTKRGPKAPDLSLGYGIGFVS